MEDQVLIKMRKQDEGVADETSSEEKSQSSQDQKSIKEGQVEETLRDQSLKKESIDEEFLSNYILSVIDSHEKDHEEYYRKKSEWVEAYRDLEYQYHQGPFENSSKVHLPLIMMYGKATHARLWQMFQNQMNFFGVTSNHEAYEEKETLVRNFMNWTLNKYCNRGNGVKDVFDAWLTDVCILGSGVLKLYWDRHVVDFLDVEQETEIIDDVTFNNETLSADVSQKIRFKSVDKQRTEVKECPKVGVVPLEYFKMPPGYLNPQEAPWVSQDVWLTDEELKFRAQSKKFYADVVEKVIEQRRQKFSSVNSSLKSAKDVEAYLEGIESGASNEDDIKMGNENHHIIEWYGKAYITKEMSDDVSNDIDKLPQEVVIWVHKASRKMLGWTYLYRISPNGERPFFKADYIPSRHRSYGIGVAELVFSIGNHVDALTNLRLDNGTLASLQMGFYRATSSLKPDLHQLKPGTLFPVEDINDVRFANFPYLANFAAGEQQMLQGVAERTLAISDLQLGQTQGVSGALRNATGASILSKESQVQLTIHFDRIARPLNKFLRSLFVLSRERMSNTLVFRVTGENGEPIFGNVNREDLKGDFDFDISVDILAATEGEKQQRAQLVLQSTMNPLLMQQGIVSPSNVYNAMKEYLKANGVKRIDDIISKPQGYEGKKLSPTDRVFRIALGMFTDPPIEETITMNENHQESLNFYEKFKQSEMYGLYTKEEQIAALERLIQNTQQALMAQQNAAIANQAGSQIPMNGMMGQMSPTDQAQMNGAMMNGQSIDQGFASPDVTGEARGPLV